MNRQAMVRGVLLGLVIAVMVPAISSAEEVWTGPSITFTKPDLADWNLPENQDALTPGVILTRQGFDVLYNTVLEVVADGWSGGSPLDTEWGVGAIEDYAVLTYMPFIAYGEYDIGGAGMGGNMTQPSVLHLISEDIYIPIVFNSWSCCNAGGFSYTRGTAPTTPTASSTWGSIKAMYE